MTITDEVIDKFYDGLAENAKTETEMQGAIDLTYNQHETTEVVHQPAHGKRYRKQTISVNGQKLQKRC